SGDTSTYNGKKVSIASLAPGTYTIQLTVSDNDGMTDSDTMLLGIKNADDGEDVVELEKPGVKLRQYPVGVEDEVYGKEGSTQAFVTILIYADAELTNLIATTTSNGDGSVSPVGIGDNSFAEVYVIARDQDGNTSKAKKLKNDIQPPVILHTSPNDEADKVKRNTKVVITFNEIMNEGLTILAFSIDGDVTGMLRVDGKRLVFIPDGLLEANTTYTVIISGVAADLAGNPIGVELVFTFTTGNK
ncbi:MAG: Ig-like domain-containing protein, partial [Anaerolineae bacterium]|nr:Ig-like domain-containing protein [Anaerolineae bacterium]